MEKTIKPIEVQKELMTKKVEANFSHYTAGNLYYTVELVDSASIGTYQFPISTVDPITKKEWIETETRGQMEVDSSINEYKLSEDLGTTSFSNKMKGSELNRWIKKAIETENFVKVA